MNTFVSQFYFKCGRCIEVSDVLCVFPSGKDKHSPTVMNVYKEVLIVDWFLFDFSQESIFLISVRQERWIDVMKPLEMKGMLRKILFKLFIQC